MTAEENAGRTAPLVSVIIPARNEEHNIGRCLDSLLQQHGLPFEIIVVNDGSTDKTRFVAERYREITVLDADPLPANWTGKNNAAWTGAKAARGSWLLFTDADTYHRRASLRRAVREAIAAKADLLSYSPKQEMQGFWQHALMPLIFGELARTYPPRKVSDPNSPYAAANGQYLLISREAYDAIGGHATIATSILEDVEIARAVKASGRRVKFRYGREAVRTRMYRSFSEMWEGWTKNLALLFPHPAMLALRRTVELMLLIFAVVMFFSDEGWRVTLPAFALALVLWANFYSRIRKAHFDFLSTMISPAGLPLYAILLLRSRLHHTRKSIAWKGRTYQPSKVVRKIPKQSLASRVEPPNREWQLQLLEDETLGKRAVVQRRQSQPKPAGAEATAAKASARVVAPSQTANLNAARIPAAVAVVPVAPPVQSSVPAPSFTPMRDNGRDKMNPTVYLTRKAEFSAAHVYHNPELTAEENTRIFGKCNNPNGHGHNYTLEITVKGEVDPNSGFVIDLKRLKEVLQEEVLEAFDHRHLNKEVPEFANQIPSTENIAVSIWKRLEPKLKIAKMHRVRVYETPDLFVDFYGEA